MAGFLYVTKNRIDSIKKIIQKYQVSIECILKKGISLKETIETENGVAFVFDKINFSSENVIRFKTGDFIIVIGTMFYKRKMGLDALRYLYEDFSEDSDIFNDFCGNFCVLIFKKGELYIFNDYNGLCHVYSNNEKTVFSNSFLAVVKTLKKKTESDQEIYEYISHGAMYGNSTMIQEVKRLDSYNLHRIFPSYCMIPKSIHISSFDVKDSFENQLNFVVESLINYFQMLRENIGDKICSALSGGYDSRLMLALFLKSGINPYLYVYGDDKAIDVRVSKLICKGENLHINHYDKMNYPKIEPEQWLEVLKFHYHFTDGQSITGAFDTGVDIFTRKKRSNNAILQVNGGGGEIYRNFWHLPNRELRIMTFLKAIYDYGSFFFYTDQFKKKKYFQNFKRKIKLILKTNSNRISRRQIEMLYPLLRLRYWMGPNNSSNNLISYAITPYAEPIFTIPSYNIPLPYKESGKFEAKLIKIINPKIAKYSSGYGFNFFDPIPFFAKLNNFLNVYRPIFLRPHIRDANQRISKKRISIPFYLKDRYIRSVFDTKVLEVRRYVHIDRIPNYEILNRALTVELLLTDRF
ncbi:MAG: hypothetical protein JXK07_03170 [Spirochaetes bacterium]|nr:hypothetical protein [Spirochaetota bacterium]